MEIIDATTVAVRALISHWKENGKSEELDGLYWRQRLDIMTKKLTVGSLLIPSSRVAVGGGY